MSINVSTVIIFLDPVYCLLANECLMRTVLLLSSRCPHILQQQCSFRRAYRRPESRKVEEDLSPSHTQTSEAPAPRRPTTTPHSEHPVPPNSPRAFGRLLRPFVFTVGVRCFSLRGCRGPSPKDNVMSVHRLRLRPGGHLAVRSLEVSSPELL